MYLCPKLAAAPLRSISMLQYEGLLSKCKEQRQGQQEQQLLLQHTWRQARVS